MPQPPQFAPSVASAASHPFAVLPSQSSRPATHVRPQDVPSHVEVAPATAGHGVQDVPHVATSASETHVPPQSWKPASHAMPQWPLSQTAVPCAGAVHAVAQSPQWSASVVVSTHIASQRVGVPPLQPLAHA